VKAMISGTSSAKITSIASTRASGAPLVWSRTNAKLIIPAEMT
jgi:hypothetical protein